MGFVCYISHAILFGPRWYGVYSLPKIYTEGGITSLKILLDNLQSNSEVSKLILILIYVIQLYYGITIPYLECGT